MIRRASFVVVPIDPRSHQLSAGSTLVTLAAALGKAVVAASPGLREVIRHEDTGLLVRPGDPCALAAAIRRLWEHPEEAAAFGRRGRALMETHYSPEAQVARFRELAGVG